MKNIKKKIATLLTAAVLISSCTNINPPSISKEATSNAFTAACTSPPPDILTTNKQYAINVNHIFCGYVIKKDNLLTAVGFHSAPGGKIPTSIKIRMPDAKTTIKKDNTTAIYVYANTANLNTFSTKAPFTLENFQILQGAGIAIKPYSSMFPLDCSADQVIESISYASTQVPLPTDLEKEVNGNSAPIQPPQQDVSKYCYNNGAIFKITLRFVQVKQGNNYIYRINTAYPAFQ
ncbi:EndoU domain-containing protein [Pseudomonas protegens]|uniref:EndoU domain-containing protein n=1 Tax=Pseudomonas protegens TaxID=380021 RepID=UPI0021C7A190|nr:EndoU domain-containing protein [Pseudomonas protegens]MCU1765331.1 EndoU domain-containing protein [Pseudomonas protegens]